MADVVIVGAGAAGLTAAYTLQQVGGLSVKILEANSDVIGGRLRKDNTTFEFPIDIGAEWIHTDRSILSKIVNHELPPTIETILHDFGNLVVWDGDEFYTENENYGENYKWVNYTWWDFFNDHVASFVRDDIVLGCVVDQIDYAGTSSVVVSCENGEIYEASYAIVTTSIQVLQDGLIEFVPELPEEHQDALNQFEMAGGLKVFLEFQQTFYPLVWEVESDYYDFSFDCYSTDYSERVFYDETFGQTTDSHVMGLFAYGGVADRYLEQVSSEEALVDYILSELDKMFDTNASNLFLDNYVVQLWSNESYIRTGYTQYVAGNHGPIQVLQIPVDGKLFLRVRHCLLMERVGVMLMVQRCLADWLLQKSWTSTHPPPDLLSTFLQRRRLLGFCRLSRPFHCFR